MIASIFSAKTPQDGVAVAVKVNRLIAFGIVTATSGAHGFTAAIIIRHEVISAIHRVSASAYPGDWRWLAAGRTRSVCTPAAAAQSAAHGAVAPVFAALRVPDFLNRALGKRTCYR